MKCLSVVLVAALLVQVMPCSVQGSQKGDKVVPGAKVRIKAPSVSKRLLIGTIVTIDADTLVLRPIRHTIWLVIPLASVSKLAVSQGLKRKTLEGAVRGLLVGAGFGVLLGYAVGPEENCSFIFCSRGEVAGLYGTFLGTVGLVVGALAGTGMRTDKWERVPLGRIRLGLLPQRRGGLALSFDF